MGPELSKISSKMKPAWLYRWIKNPHSVQHDTLMPNFGFSDQEVRDLVAFLVEEYVDLDLETEQIAKDAQLVSKGEAIAGKGLIFQIDQLIQLLHLVKTYRYPK